jgi:glycosyltransferase involved in cell wall biosynthesis
MSRPAAVASEPNPGTPEGLSLVIPVFNEREAAPGLGERLAAVRDDLPTPLEVILVDDGSTDGTAEILDTLTGPGVRVIRHQRNRGYGASLTTGVRAASHPWVAICDADGTYPLDRLPELHRRATEEELDMVIGARTGANVHIPWLRRLPKWLLGKLAGWLSGSRIPDLNSGLRVMRRSVVERYLHLMPAGFSFTATITLIMLSSHFRLDWVEIDYERRAGRSKISPVSDTLNFLQLICRTVLWFNPLRIFIPLSLLLFVAGAAIFVGCRLAHVQAPDVTIGVLLVAAVQLLAVGMLADLIDKRMG